ncbi:MAG: cobalamin B12-binding domain protein [Spirochaetes bacterium]|nr:MAG: cobalamin B12-binding domain protein [Spirochaetota bacterium]
MVLAEAAFQVLESLIPETAARWNQRQRNLALEDLAHHVRFFGTAALYGDRPLLLDYVNWLKVLAEKLGFRMESLALSTRALAQAAENLLVDEDIQRFSDYCAKAEVELLAPDSPENVYRVEPGLDNLYVRQYTEALLGGRRSYATQLIKGLAAQGKSLIDLYDEIFIPSQQKVGYLWHTGKISVVQEHYVTAATQAIISGQYETFFFDHGTDMPTMFAACAEGELHEIGIRYIADYFQAQGWNTRYFGANVPSEDLVREIVANKPTVVALSATLSVNLPAMETLVGCVRSQKGYDPVVLVGGRAVSVAGDLWKRIGADGSAGQAKEAYSIARAHMNGRGL